MATKKICPVVVSYPAKDPKTGDELKFDMDYYTAKHMPLIAKVWGKHNLLSWSINTFPNPDPATGQPALYGVQATCIFASVEDFKAALADPGSQVTGADVKRFSNIYPAIWTGEPGASADREVIDKQMKEFVYGEAGL